MSGDSSLGIGIGLALKSYGRGLTYVKTDRALDLGNLEPFTIPDLSGNANTATLYSGIYVSTNGTTDKAINADCSDLGSGSYKISGKVRTTNGLAAWLQIAAEYRASVNTTANQWVDFESSVLTSTAFSVVVGFGEFDGDEKYSAADWSDIRLQKQVGLDWVTVAHWKLYDSADASLDGYPALDCVGGFHGAHVGCASGSGEGVDADVAGISATLDDYMWFDDETTYIEVADNTDVEYAEGQIVQLDANVLISDYSSGSSQFVISKLGQYAMRFTATGALQFAIGGVASASADSTLTFTDGVAYSIRIIYNTVTNQVSYFSKSINSDTYTAGSVVAFSSSPTNPASPLLVSANVVGTEVVGGIIYDASVTIDSVLKWHVVGSGNADADWVDQTVNGNNGTVNGNPVTVGQKRETILQTAGEDFNKRMRFDGVNDYVEVGNDSSLTLGADDFEIEAMIYPETITGSSRTIYGRYNSGSNERSIIFRVTSAGALLLITSSNGLSGSLQTANTADGVITARSKYKIKVVRSGTSATFYINDDVVASSGSVVSNVYNSTAVAYLGAQGVGNSDFFKGSIWNVNITIGGSLISQWLGNGNTNADWEDQIGANNGTVNGSPSLYHVAESESTAGQDALGNAIENPRPNERVLNLTTGTGYAEVADSASLDLTTAATWELWPDFRSTGSERFILSKYDSGGNNRSWAIGVENSVGGNNTLNVSFGDPANGTFEARLDWAITEGVACYHIIYDGSLTGTARCKLYKNGVLIALSASTSNPPASLYQNNTPVLVGGVYIGGVVSRIFDEQLGDIRIYNRVLTADEILKNYNARKGAYGL
jgi:hypothetical protein